MNMAKSSENGSESRSTLLFALLLLFFLQILGTWLESLYRISLTRLGPGLELYGILLLLLPFTLFAVRREQERRFLWGALLIFLASRVLCPCLGPPGQVVAGGVGLSAFLIILACAFSTPFGGLKGDMGQAVGIAMLLSVALRAWGSSADISMEGTTAALGWLAIPPVLYLFRSAMASPADAPAPIPAPTPHLTLAMLGLFGNLALVYLVFSCPMVVCAWSGYAQLGFSGTFVSGCVLLTCALALLLAQRVFLPTRRLGLLWNGVLLLFLVGGLLLGRPTLPPSPETGPVFVNGDNLLTRYLLYAALLLAPVTIFNSRRIAGFPACARPRNAVPAVLAGMALLIITALSLQITNVWGYVPQGTLLRNRFHLPFLLAGAAILAPWVAPLPDTPAGRPLRTRFLATLAMLLAVLGLAGTLAHPPRIRPAQGKRDFTVLTYNMQQGSHQSGKRNYQEQLDLLRRLNPAIIGLQESDTPRVSGGHVDAVRYFAESLGYHAYYGPSSIAGTFGTAILSRYPIRNPRTFFTFSTVDEVGTSAAEIEVDGKTIAFFCNHPAGGDRVMQAHIDALIAEARRFPHVIALGDFNFTAREPYYASLSGVLRDSAAELGETNVTYHGIRSNLADEIDHIFVSPNFRVIESHYLPAPESETDHPAHWSVLRME